MKLLKEKFSGFRIGIVGHKVGYKLNLNIEVLDTWQSQFEVLEQCLVSYYRAGFRIKAENNVYHLLYHQLSFDLDYIHSDIIMNTYIIA